MTQSRWARLRAWLQDKLGDRYPVVIDTLDRAVAAFLTTVAGQAVAADLFNWAHFRDLAEWQQIGLAGLVAAFSVIKSAVLTAITGVPALLSPISRTLRSARYLAVVRHAVPVRKPRHAARYHQTPGGRA